MDTSIMDYAVESLEKTSDIERKAMLNKLHSMQWLKSTSHSANPEKIKAIVYKQEQDEDKKIKDKISTQTEIVKISVGEEPDKYSSTSDTCKTSSCNDTMPENDENMWNKNIDAANLFPNANKLADQKNEEDMLSIVESIVTAKLEAKLCVNKEHKDQSSTSENNTEDTMQDAVCTNSSNLQKIDGDTEESNLIKQSDGNNNDSKSITPCMLKMNDKQKSTCKITNVENSKVPIESKDKDVKANNLTKTNIKAGSNTNLTKDNEKSSSPSNDFKKAVSNSSKSLSTIDKNGKDHFNNKQNNKKNTFTRKQEFAKQRNISRNEIEKEIKNVKPNLVKTGVETADTTCQSKNSNKDKGLQKQQQTTSKQFASKTKGQESLKKNTSTLNFSDDKNKTEKTVHMPDLPLNESEKKNEKIVNEKNVQSDQRANRDFRKNTTFVAQYKNSTFSKPTQHIPRTGQTPIYGRNPSYAYNNPRFDKDGRNGIAERRVTKKEYAPVNAFAKSNTRTEEFDTSNLENCAKQKEIIQPTNVKSTCEIDTLVFNSSKDTNPVKVETHLIQSTENTNSSVDHPEQGPTTPEQCHVETNDILKVNVDQQPRETNNEGVDPFKHSSNLPSDMYATNSQINTHQYSLKLENVQRTNDVNQLESSQATWNQSSDNAAQKSATIMNLQQSIQNMHFNTQHTYTQAGNPTRQQMAPWEPTSSKFYDQYFSVSDAMRLAQIPNTFNAPLYEYNNASISNDNIATSTLETTMSSRENSNVYYRYGSNVQQRPVMASDFPGHSVSPCQTNQSRWSSSVQDGFHVEHPYVATQPAMMHVYNPAAFGAPDDFNNTHTMDYVSHPVIYTPSPYMQTWNSQLQYPMPVLYNTPCTNYTTFPHSNQPNNFNNSMHDQQYKHNPYAQTNNYVRDTYSDTNTCAIQARNTADNGPTKPNYYYKKYQDNSRTVYDVPQYVPPVSYSRAQQGMSFVPATSGNQYNAPYYPPNQKYYKQNMANYMKNPKSQDFACDDNGSEDIPPIISPKEFVTDNVNLSNKTDQFATRVFKPEFKTKSNSGYRPPPSLVPRGGFRRNTTFQDFPKEYTYPVSIGRGTYKTKKT